MQLLHLLAAERGGRLVHHDQLCVARERAQDLDLLLVGRPQPPRQAHPRQVEAGRFGERRELAVQSTVADEPRIAGLDAEEDVLRDRQVGHDRGLLGDRGHVVLECLTRRAERHLLPLEQHPPAIGPVHARHDLSEGRLAGTVLADERVNRALADREAHTRERLDAAKVLGDVQELEVRAFGASGHGGATVLLAGPLSLELRGVRLRHDASVRQPGEHVDPTAALAGLDRRDQALHPTCPRSPAAGSRSRTRRPRRPP